MICPKQYSLRTAVALYGYLDQFLQALYPKRLLQRWMIPKFIQQDRWFVTGRENEWSVARFDRLGDGKTGSPRRFTSRIAMSKWVLCTSSIASPTRPASAVVRSTNGSVTGPCCLTATFTALTRDCDGQKITSIVPPQGHYSIYQVGV